MIIYIIIAILIIIIILYKFTHGYNLTNTVNKLMEKNCSDPVIFDTTKLSWAKHLRDNYKTIRQEFYNYTNPIPYHKNLIPELAECDKYTKWKTLYLRAYGVNTTIAEKFPKTMQLINALGSMCTLALFSILGPNAY